MSNEPEHVNGQPSTRYRVMAAIGKLTNSIDELEQLGTDLDKLDDVYTSAPLNVENAIKQLNNARKELLDRWAKLAEGAVSP